MYVSMLHREKKHGLKLRFCKYLILSGGYKLIEFLLSLKPLDDNQEDIAHHGKRTSSIVEFFVRFLKCEKSSSYQHNIKQFQFTSSFEPLFAR